MANPDRAPDEETPSRPAMTPQSGLSWAMRLGTEMVSATLIGIGMGYGLDRWLGTRPWLTLLFFLFGVVAGFLNVYRAANPEARWPGDQDQKQ